MSIFFILKWPMETLIWKFSATIEEETQVYKVYYKNHSICLYEEHPSDYVFHKYVGSLSS